MYRRALDAGPVTIVGRIGELAATAIYHDSVKHPLSPLHFVDCTQRAKEKANEYKPEFTRDEIELEDAENVVGGHDGDGTHIDI